MAWDDPACVTSHLVLKGPKQIRFLGETKNGLYGGVSRLPGSYAALTVWPVTRKRASYYPFTVIGDEEVSALPPEDATTWPEPSIDHDATTIEGLDGGLIVRQLSGYYVNEALGTSPRLEYTTDEAHTVITVSIYDPVQDVVVEEDIELTFYVYLYEQTYTDNVELDTDADFPSVKTISEEYAVSELPPAVFTVTVPAGVYAANTQTKFVSEKQVISASGDPTSLAPAAYSWKYTNSERPPKPGWPFTPTDPGPVTSTWNRTPYFSPVKRVFFSLIPADGSPADGDLYFSGPPAIFVPDAPGVWPAKRFGVGDPAIGGDVLFERAAYALTNKRRPNYTEPIPEDESFADRQEAHIWPIGY